MVHYIAPGLIILILISSISLSNAIKDGFPTPENNTNNLATNAESRDEEGQTPGIVTAHSKVTAPQNETAPQNPSLLGNNSYNALPAPNFLNYYINQTTKQIKGIVCLEISQESNKPENIIKIPCSSIFIFIPNNNFTKDYKLPISPSINPYNYNHFLPYQLELLPKLITELYSKNKDYNCGIIEQYVTFKTEIISCTNIGILMRYG